MTPVDIRLATPEDVDKLVARSTDPYEQQAERDRLAAQQRGESLLLIAWEGDTIRGRLGRLYLASKYDEVRAALGVFPEINGLDAWPPGQGVGTQLIEAAEAMAVERGFDRIGIGVVVDNVAARRLYERLGYEYWGEVVDRSEYFDDAGNLTHVDEEPAAYLVKRLI
ncbi:MAG: hypothetical protein QOJ00_2057 [Actinomycetota bacterium]